MSTVTPNLGLVKPGVNDPTDQDLWGGYLNEDLDKLDAASIAYRLPIGSLYFNGTDGTNPGTLLGYGTWTAFGQGRVLLGVGTGTDVNAVQRTFAAGDTGGEYVHTQTTAEVGRHDHDVPTVLDTSGGSSPGILYDGSGVSPDENREQTELSVAPSAMPWMQPYLTVYIWKRDA